MFIELKTYRRHLVRSVQSLAFTLLVSACGGGGSNTNSPVNTTVLNEPGRHDINMSIQGVDRQFIISVPATVEFEDGVPVVFMFHGTGGDGEKFYNISQWKEKGEQEGFITVFPSALIYCYWEDTDYDGVLERKLKTKWDSDYIGDEAPLCTDAEIDMLPPAAFAEVEHQKTTQTGLKNDLLFVDSMLDYMEDHFAIDTRRIYASGFSNGGGMVGRLAVERSERFAALSSSAGMLQADVIVAARPHTFIFTLGNIDTPALAYFNQFIEPDISQLPLDTSLLAYAQFSDDVIQPFLDVLQLENTHIEYTASVINGVATGEFTYPLSIQNGNTHQFRLLMIDGLDHLYPDGNNHDIVMADYLWELFRTESLN